MSETSAEHTSIAALADQCVKCGLCVPLCPTYRVARTEAESPRGRVAFASALAAGASPTQSMIDHLDHCLACMTCERVCPSHVKYGELIVETRHLLRQKPERGIDFLVRRPRLLRAALRIANLPLIKNFFPEVPRIPELPRFGESTAKVTRGRVGLFIGCVASIVDRDVHVAARRILRALGYEVVVPATQGCCGALSLHAGDVESCRDIGEPTRRAFVDSRVDTVLVSASGCFGTLRDQTLANTRIKVRDIHEFIASDERIGTLQFSPRPDRITLHTPCTQTNVVRADGAVKSLLARIPQFTIEELPTEPRCCGAAGDYFLRHPETANALRAEKIDQTISTNPDLLVTSNVGCRAFLANGLRHRNTSIKVTHPIVLLASQLQN